jgi:hypothetical protein
MATGKKTSVYLPDELDRAYRESGKNLPDLIRAGLEAGERSRSDQLADTVERLADVVERLLRKLDDGYTLEKRAAISPRD